MTPQPLFVEIGPDWLKARHGHDGVELPLERGADGRLTAPGKERIIAALKDFLKAKNWQPRARAWCAISSRGISLRQLSLPGGTQEEFHERLLLQIEAEFPLPPDELAWGWQALGQPRPSNGSGARQNLLVAAVKKELVADYYEIFRACATEPVFTLAALARWNTCGQPEKAFAMLDVGVTQSELTIFEDSVPVASRIIFWDGKNVSRPLDAPVDTLAQNIRGSVAGGKVFVSGNGVSKEFAERLAWLLGNGCKCEAVPNAPGTGNSTALAGLEKIAGRDDGSPLLIRWEPTSRTSTRFANLDWKKWGGRVGILIAALLLLPYAEALLLKSHLEKKVAAFKTESERLKVIDRELVFLRDLKLAQPPYLDVLYVFSKSVPPGTRFDSLSLNGHGQVSLRCAFRDGQQVADFRNKLVDSGFFTNVVVEEQTPTPDRQKVNVRISAQEKTAPQMQAASARLAAAESTKNAKTNSPAGSTNAPALPPTLRKESK